MRHDGINALGERASLACLVRLIGFAQRTLYEAVFGIGQGVVGGVVQLVLDALRLFVTGCDEGVVLGQTLHEFGSLAVAFQKFDGEVAGGIVRAQFLVLLENGLDAVDAELQFGAVVHVNVAGQRGVAHVLVDGNHRFKEFPDALPRTRCSGHHGHTQ